MSASASELRVLSALNFHFTMSLDLGVDIGALFSSFDEAGDHDLLVDPTPIALTRAADGFFELRIDGVVAFRTLDLGVLVHQTVWEITRRGVETRREAVILHAAAVLVDGTYVVISGRSGAGKSTLAAQLVADGAVYLSDEAVVVESDGGVGATIRRPIHLNRDSLELLRLEPLALVQLPDGSGYVPVPDHDDGAHLDAGRGVAIVLLERHSSEFVVTHPRRSELGVALVRESFHDTATTQHGLEIVKELSIRCSYAALSGGTGAERANTARILAQSAEKIA